jgi:hypothetical protein
MVLDGSPSNCLEILISVVRNFSIIFKITLSISMATKRRLKLDGKSMANIDLTAYFDVYCKPFVELCR